MSRIDEALTRARTLNTGEAPDSPPAPGVAEFPREAETTAEDVSPKLPLDAPLDPALALGAPGEGTTDGPADLRLLTLADKLVPTTRQSGSVEQYRRLAGRLHMAQAERGTKVVMITSALPGEGKTLSATNLALTLSESYKRRVLLIDADLRRPNIHQVLQLPNVSGLNDGLSSAEERKIPLIRYTDNLSVLTAGQPDSDPISALCSDRMRRVIEEASATFDWVIIDTPPVALLTDAHLLASQVDTVLLVVKAGRTPLGPIRTALDAVHRDRVLGVLLNHAHGSLGTDSYTYYGYYTPSA